MSSIIYDKSGFTVTQYAGTVFIRFHSELLSAMPCDKELTETELTDKLKEYKAMQQRYNDKEHSGLIDD